jgi:hypothetical protein
VVVRGFGGLPLPLVQLALASSFICLDSTCGDYTSIRSLYWVVMLCFAAVTGACFVSRWLWGRRICKHLMGQRKLLMLHCRVASA